VKITQINSDALNAIISIEILKADYLPKVEKALATAKNNAVIKGFRKGFVPLGVIKKMYGNSILLDELNKLVSESLNNHIESNKVEILGRPLPIADPNIDLNINNPLDFTFKYEIGLAPNVAVNSLNKKTVIAKDVIKLDDASLEVELDKLAGRYGNVTNPENVMLEEKDIVTAELVEIDGKKEKENGVTHTAVFNMDDILDQKIKTKFLKLKVGDAINIQPYDIFDNTNEFVTKSILGLKDGKPENLSDIFKATITKISRVEKATLNQELFDKIYGPGAVNSLDEFKEKMRNELEGYAVSSANNKYKEAIYNHLMENTEIQLPDAFLKKFIKSSNEKPISDEQIEQEYPAFVKGLKWNIITSNIAKDNEIKIEMEDIKEFSKNALRQQLMMYNPTGQGLPEETIDQLNNSMMAKEEHVKKSYDGALEQKLFAFIEDQITAEEKTVSFADFFDKKEK
jgi:trigger factor